MNYGRKSSKIQLNDNNLEDLLRKLQDEIFESRKNSPLIFDWYYRIHRESQQFDTDYSGEQMIRNYNLEVSQGSLRTE